MLLSECRRIGATWFIETGTYLGDTLWFMRSVDHIFSIEVQPDLARLAELRFKRHPKIKVLQGDSADQLEHIVKKIDGPCLFWLDGHYSAGITGRGSKDCPIFEEIAAIASGSKHLHSIMIDDARCFGSDPNYPEIAEFKRVSDALFPKHQFGVWNDVIHILSSQNAPTQPIGIIKSVTI
jgi:hypothetical protein